MAVVLEKIYEVAMQNYHMKLLAGEKGLYKLVDWVHVVEEYDYIEFLKGRELIVTTGIIKPDDEGILKFAKKVYETQASGLVINIGRYIIKVPQKLIEFCEEHDFPLFVLPWEVHLVDFNRDLCNLIYETEQEYNSLDRAVQKLIFSPKEQELYLSVLRQEGITRETPVRMIQCYFPLSVNKKEPRSEQNGEKKYDVTQFYYRYLRFCQQVMSKLEKKYVVFHYDLYVTIVLFDVGKEAVEQVIKELTGFYFPKEEDVAICIAVSGADAEIWNLSDKFKNLALLCRWNAKESRKVCYEEEIGVWKLLLDFRDRGKLKKYKEHVLGELEHVDVESGSEYCRILEVYLTENGNVQEVAAKCYLHRNTVTYHLKKIAEITGRNLTDSRDRNELYIAFQIKKILEL